MVYFYLFHLVYFACPIFVLFIHLFICFYRPYHYLFIIIIFSMKYHDIYICKSTSTDRYWLRITFYYVLLANDIEIIIVHQVFDAPFPKGSRRLQKWKNNKHAY